MHRQDARYAARDVSWSAVNDSILAALARADWFAAQAGDFAHARDLADHGQPWADVARAGFTMELQQLLGVVESTDVFACNCRV
jgi:hypothetical protein